MDGAAHEEKKYIFERHFLLGKQPAHETFVDACGFYCIAIGTNLENPPPADWSAGIKFENSV